MQLDPIAEPNLDPLSDCQLINFDGCFLYDSTRRYWATDGLSLFVNHRKDSWSTKYFSSIQCMRSSAYIRARCSNVWVATAFNHALVFHHLLSVLKKSGSIPKPTVRFPRKVVFNPGDNSQSQLVKSHHQHGSQLLSPLKWENPRQWVVYDSLT